MEKQKSQLIGLAVYIATTYNASMPALNEPFELQKWHERLGHLNYKDVNEMVKNRVVNGIKGNSNESLPQCTICLKGKLVSQPFGERSVRSEQPLKIIYSDICGPMRCESNGSGIYFVTFIDDYTRWSEVYILKKRNEVLNAFKSYKNLVEKQTGLKLKAFHTDNGREYLSNEFIEFLNAEGIKRRLTVPYTPQQNGVAERYNRTLVEMTRCMMFQSKLPLSFWAEAVCAANHVRNRCPTKTLNGRTLFEYWHRKIPNVSHLQVFGAKVYVLDEDPCKDKLASRSKGGIFVGYCNQSETFQVWIPSERKICITRDMKVIHKQNHE